MSQPMSATSLPYDFFAGLARRLAAPRVRARHSAYIPLSRIETAFYVALVSALFAGLCGVVVHHRSFILGRVATEEIERQSRPELMGELICERDRVIGVSIQRMFDVALVERPRAPRALMVDHRVLDGAIAAASPAHAAAVAALPSDEPAVVPLQRPATWRARSR